MDKKLIGLLLLVMLIFLVGCGQNKDKPSVSVEVVKPDGNLDIAAGEVREFTMTAKRWNFEPDTITVNKGDRVKLSITSVDVTHGFTIPEFGVNSRLEPGEETAVEFVADKSGAFQFFCSVQCGEGHSAMEGQLIVN